MTLSKSKQLANSGSLSHSNGSSNGTGNFQECADCGSSSKFKKFMKNAEVGNLF
jgi:hypothetical protein